MDGAKWQVFLNRSLDENEKNRNTITVTMLLGEFHEPVIRMEGYRLNKGSDEEMTLTTEIEKAHKEERMSGDHTKDLVESFLRSKWTEQGGHLSIRPENPCDIFHRPK